jgi:hypothetical protein
VSNSVRTVSSDRRALPGLGNGLVDWGAPPDNSAVAASARVTRSGERGWDASGSNPGLEHLREEQELGPFRLQEESSACWAEAPCVDRPCSMFIRL